MRFFSTNFALYVAIFTFTMRSTYTFLHSKTEKIKILHFRNITFMVYIIIKAIKNLNLQISNGARGLLLVRAFHLLYVSNNGGCAGSPEP